MKEHTESELKSIAVDIYDGKIFTDRHCHSEHEIKMCFMVVGLGGLSEMSNEELDNIGMLYEYMGEAGPMGVNGKPIFMSVRILSKPDTEKMFEFYEEYKKVKEEFLNKE